MMEQTKRNDKWRGVTSIPLKSNLGKANQIWQHNCAEHILSEVSLIIITPLAANSLRSLALVIVAGMFGLAGTATYATEGIEKKRRLLADIIEHAGGHYYDRDDTHNILEKQNLYFSKDDSCSLLIQKEYFYIPRGTADPESTRGLNHYFLDLFTTNIENITLTCHG